MRLALIPQTDFYLNKSFKTNNNFSLNFQKLLYFKFYAKVINICINQSMTHFQIQKRPSKLQKNHRKSLYLIFTAIIVRRTFSNI